jgi:DNA-binding winged helix-turn-helix (wHTH) protein
MEQVPQLLFDPFRLDTGNACLWHGAQPIALRPKAFEVLQCLVRHRGQLVTKDAFAEAVWPDDKGTQLDATLKVHIRELRQKLGDQPRSPQFIETVHRRGYRFIAEIIESEPALLQGRLQSSPRLISVPYFSITPNFVGRQSLFEHLETELKSGRPVVLYGLAGVGKTRVAAEYCHRHVDQYQLIWWLHAGTIDTLQTGYVTLARRLGLEVRDDEELKETVAAVQQRLQNCAPWLLVFDGVSPDTELLYNPENSDTLQYLPIGASGHVLITSRSHYQWDAFATTIEVPLLEAQEAYELLCCHLEDKDWNTGLALAQRLGYLPLALTQAAAYIKISGTLAGYLKQYRVQRTELFDPDYAPADHRDTVVTTVRLAMDALSKHAPKAIGLMTLGAYLAPIPIPTSLLLKDVVCLHDPLTPLGQEHIRVVPE